jgi:hypothetical protein
LRIGDVNMESVHLSAGDDIELREFPLVAAAPGEKSEAGCNRNRRREGRSIAHAASRAS